MSNNTYDTIIIGTGLGALIFLREPGENFVEAYKMLFPAFLGMLIYSSILHIYVLINVTNNCAYMQISILLTRKSIN